MSDWIALVPLFVVSPLLVYVGYEVYKLIKFDLSDIDISDDI